MASSAGPRCRMACCGSRPPNSPLSWKGSTGAACTRRARPLFPRRRVEPASDRSRSVAKHDSLHFVKTPSALPDDPDRLKAMLLAERAESERLRQIIKELQRHRFGRRADTLPEDQLLLALEEVEQTEAAV